MIAMMVATPAMADTTSYTANHDPYANSCSVDIIGGTGTGSVNATANFNPKSYQCAAGTYLPAGNTWSGLDDGCATCEAGYYCNGGTYQYSESGSNGADSCDEYYPGTTSAAGATSTAACYHANVSCPTISGATACDPHAATCAYTSQNTSGNYYPETSTYTGNCAMDFTCSTGYTKSTTQTVPTLPQASEDANIASCSFDGNGDCTDLNNGEWYLGFYDNTYTKMDKLTGISSCNNVPGDGSNPASPSTLPANTNLAGTSTSGQYCWCKPTSWTTFDGTTTSLSAAWVFVNSYDLDFMCAEGCTELCTRSDVRSALFSVIGASPQCVANTITINWGGYGANNNQSQQTQCTYGGDVTTPTQAPSKRGHTFDGWTFTLGN